VAAPPLAALRYTCIDHGVAAARLSTRSTLLSLDLRTAINQGMLCAPKIVLAGFDMPNDEELAALREAMGDEDVSALEAGRVSALAAALEALQGAPLSAYDQRKAIAFCSNLAEAEQLAAQLTALAEAHEQPLDAWFVQGSMSVKERTAVLKAMRDCPAAAVVASAKALQEGVDAPWCDTVAIMSCCKDPRILVQMIGRALRLHHTECADDPAGRRAKRVAHIVIPVLNDYEFEPVINVILALMSVDADIAGLVHMLGATSSLDTCVLKARIDARMDALFMHTGVDVTAGLKEQIKQRLADEFDRKTFAELAAHLAAHPADTAFRALRDNTPAGAALNKLRNKLRRGITNRCDNDRIAMLSAAFPDIDWSAVNDAKWDRWYAQLEQHHATHGSVARTGMTKRLVRWCDKQKRKHADGRLPRAHYDRLAMLGFWSAGRARPRLPACARTPVPAAFDKAAWVATCKDLARFVAEHGDLPRSQGAHNTDPKPNEIRLYKFGLKARKDYKDGVFDGEPTPKEERGAWCKQLLDAIPQWNWKHKTRRTSHRAHGGAAGGSGAAGGAGLGARARMRDGDDDDPGDEDAAGNAMEADVEAGAGVAGAEHAPKRARRTLSLPPLCGAVPPEDGEQPTVSGAAPSGTPNAFHGTPNATPPPPPSPGGGIPPGVAPEATPDKQAAAAAAAARSQAARERLAAAQAAAAAEAAAAAAAAAATAARIADAEMEAASAETEAEELAAAAAAEAAASAAQAAAEQAAAAERARLAQNRARADEAVAALLSGSAAAVACIDELPKPPRKRRHERDIDQPGTDEPREPWDATRFARPGGTPPARDTAAAAAVAQVRAAARTFTEVARHVVEQLQAAEPQEFYFMRHSKFHTSRWIRQLLTDAREKLTGGEATHVLLTFGVASNPEARSRIEFVDDVPAAFGYHFSCRDGVIVNYQGVNGGADLDGREVETPLKALLKAARKCNVRGNAVHAALAKWGVVPFDHPACATPNTAPRGMKDESMLVTRVRWTQMCACRSTAQLKAIVDELQELANRAADDADAAADAV
jgi:hypothetical protein